MTLIATLVKILAPCLPFLQGLATKAVEKGSEKLGEKGAEGLTQLLLAKKLWDKLLPKVDAKAAAKEAADDVAKAPENEDAVAALRNQLRKILEAPENAALAAEIITLLKDDEASVGGTKFHIEMEGCQTGATGDRNTVTMNLAPKAER